MPAQRWRRLLLVPGLAVTAACTTASAEQDRLPRPADLQITATFVTVEADDRRGQQALAAEVAAVEGRLQPLQSGTRSALLRVQWAPPHGREGSPPVGRLYLAPLGAGTTAGPGRSVHPMVSVVCGGGRDSERLVDLAPEALRDHRMGRGGGRPLCSVPMAESGTVLVSYQGAVPRSADELDLHVGWTDPRDEDDDAPAWVVTTPVQELDQPLLRSEVD